MWATGGPGVSLWGTLWPEITLYHSHPFRAQKTLKVMPPPQSFLNGFGLYSVACRNAIMLCPLHLIPLAVCPYPLTMMGAEVVIQTGFLL